MFRLNRLKIFQLETKSDERGDEGLTTPSWKIFQLHTRNNFVLEFLDYFVDHHVIQPRMYRKRSLN
jgi:hypothetical protein